MAADLAADHHDVGVVVRMRIVIVVMNLTQGFAGNVHPIRQVIITGGDSQFACLRWFRVGQSGPRCAR